MNIRSLLVLFLLVAPFLLAERTGWPLPSHEIFLNVVLPPPVMGTPADRADLDAVIGVQAHAGKAELAHAEKSVGFTVFTFSEVRGEEFNAAAYPKTEAFFKKLEETVNAPKNFIKDTYHRERPYKAFPDQVKALVSIEGNYSYPSGHSTRADYLGCAMRVSLDRVLGGMHFPSDTAAGRTLAEAIYADLMADPGFKADLEQLRKAEYQKP